ncbi:EF-hand domain-containing protein [Oryzibacter oryziterrae]|uniref:EF-hand domain-containing protein n=1 Tax=Oryzibacter oryziterrae TaxID=2766474 RepID=UPI001F3D5489|nr:hypothetical protein [Oryzibacter oryziterrae]
MKTLTLTSLAALSLIATAGLASAAPGDSCGRGPAMGARLMEKFDTNKDGKITQEEIDAVEAKNFAEANKDGQGGVTIQEFEPYFWAQHREMMVRAFQRLDRNGDGEISKEEMAGQADRLIARFDRNGDKALSRDDLPPPPKPGDEPRGWMKWGHHGGAGQDFGRMGHRMGMMGDCGPGPGGMAPGGDEEGGPEDAAPAQ